MSSIVLGPASLPGPGGDFVPTPAKGDQTPPASGLAPANSDPASAGPSSEVRQPEAPPPQRIPRWLVRVELFLRVMLRMYIGLAICYAPWSHAFWDQNPLFLQFPAVGAIALNGAVRGLVMGLGLLNLWIAFQDALRRGRD
ncbi:MAG TPA: hypothetical protein VME23_19500 [Terracidiphilus sp.]|nr:hypothetical protein [Terracidiphilus sp.]